MVISSKVASRKGDRSERLEFWLLYVAAFLVFLGVAVIRRVMPWNWLSVSWSVTGPRSVWSEARTAASASVPFAFMA